MTDYGPDCDAVTAEQECGECKACEESVYRAIAHTVETGAISDSEAIQTHPELYH